MITSQRYLVIHRPKKGEAFQYFGPFVSQRMADDFTDELPSNDEAFTVVKPLENPQTLTHH